MNKVHGKKALEEQSFEVIRSHIIDPDNSELPVESIYVTVRSAARKYILQGI